MTAVRHMVTIEWTEIDFCGLGDHVRSTFNVVLRGTGEVDGWMTETEMPTMVMRGTPAEIRAVVRELVGSGAMTLRRDGKPTGLDTAWATICRVDFA